MKQPGTRKLLAYWDECRGERATPERADIDPAPIRSLLRDIFILEIDRRRTLPIRVAGARVGSLFLRELKGARFTGLYATADRDCLRAVVESVLDDAAPAVAGVVAAPLGYADLDLELLLLPLRHRGKTHARMLGALTPASTPAWMGLVETHPLRFVSLRIIRREGFPHPPQEAAALPSAAILAPTAQEPRAAFAPRVVQGGRTS